MERKGRFGGFSGFLYSLLYLGFYWRETREESVTGKVSVEIVRQMLKEESVSF